SQALEHLRRKRRQLFVGDRRWLLARLAAELLAQLSEALRVHAWSPAVAHLRAEFSPPLGVDRAVGIPEPLEERRWKTFDVGGARNQDRSLGGAEACAQLREDLRIEPAATCTGAALPLSRLAALRPTTERRSERVARLLLRGGFGTRLPERT